MGRPPERPEAISIRGQNASRPTSFRSRAKRLSFRSASITQVHDMECKISGFALQRLRNETLIPVLLTNSEATPMDAQIIPSYTTLPIDQ